MFTLSYTPNSHMVRCHSLASLTTVSHSSHKRLHVRAQGEKRKVPVVDSLAPCRTVDVDSHIGRQSRRTVANTVLFRGALRGSVGRCPGRALATPRPTPRPQNELRGGPVSARKALESPPHPQPLGSPNLASGERARKEATLLPGLLEDTKGRRPSSRWGHWEM